VKSEEGKDREHDDDEPYEIDDAVHGESSVGLPNSAPEPVFHGGEKILISIAVAHDLVQRTTPSYKCERLWTAHIGPARLSQGTEQAGLQTEGSAD
jgi:hypothetical protein